MKRRNFALVIFSLFLIFTVMALASCGAVNVNITYDANGGAFSNGDTALVLEKTMGALLVEPVSPSKTGEIFVGWSTDAEGSELWDFASDRPTADMTLYAVWQPAEAELISVTGAEIVDNEVRLSVGLETDSIDFSDMVTVSDYASWMLASDSTGSEVIDNKTVADLPTGESTYYVVVSSKDSAVTKVYTLKITRDNSATVTLDANDGVLSVTEATLAYGESFTLPVPTRTGHVFRGWMLDNDYVTDESGASLAASAITSSVTFTAAWEKESYTVTLSSDSADAGSVAGGGQYEYSDTVTVTATANAGYNFVGWYNGENVLVSSDASYSFEISANMTLTARFEVSEGPGPEPEPEEFTVTVSSANTTAGSVTGGGQYRSGTTVTVTATANTGYKFIGWYNGENVLVSSSASYGFEISANMTLTARFELKQSGGGNQEGPGTNTDNNGWTGS